MKNYKIKIHQPSIVTDKIIKTDAGDGFGFRQPIRSNSLEYITEAMLTQTVTTKKGDLIEMEIKNKISIYTDKEITFNVDNPIALELITDIFVEINRLFNLILYTRHSTRKDAAARDAIE